MYLIDLPLRAYLNIKNFVFIHKVILIRVSTCKKLEFVRCKPTVNLTSRMNLKGD